MYFKACAHLKNRKKRPAAIRQPGAMKTALQFGFGDGEDPGTALGVSD